VAAGRKAAFNADPNGRDWGIQALYMRSKQSQVLFKGTADVTERASLTNEVERVIVKEVVNITANDSTVVHGDINVAGEFIGGDKVIVHSNDETDSSSTTNPATNSGTIDPVVKAELALLMGSIMQVVQPQHFATVIEKINQIEAAFTGLQAGDEADVGFLLMDITDLNPAAAEPIRTSFNKPVLQQLISDATKSTIEFNLP
ncbi:MAG: hypothetical protein AAF902_24570, partial [Chloroflexota bacterium]